MNKSARWNLDHNFAAGKIDRITKEWGTAVVDDFELLSVLLDLLGEGVLSPTDFNVSTAGGLNATLSAGRVIVGADGNYLPQWMKNPRTVAARNTDTTYVYATMNRDATFPTEPEIVLRSVGLDASAATPNAGTHQLARLVASGGSISTFDSLPAARVNLQTLKANPLILAEGQNLQLGTATGTKIGTGTTQKVGFYNSTPVAKQTVTGSRSANAALADLLTKLASLGLIVDGSS